MSQTIEERNRAAAGYEAVIINGIVADCATMNTDTLKMCRSLGLEPEDFSGSDYRVIYRAAVAAYVGGGALDYQTLKLEVSKIDGDVSIPEWNATSWIDPLNGPKFVNEIKIVSFARKMSDLAQKTAEIAYQFLDPRDAMMKLWAEMAKLEEKRGSKKGLTHISDALGRAVDSIFQAADRREQGVISGVKTGFTMLDKMLGGLQKDDLLVLAARPGLGKTSLAMSIAQNVAKEGGKVGFFTLEMSDEQLVKRLLSMETGINSNRLRSGDLFEDLERGREADIILSAAGEIKEYNLYLDDTPGMTLAEIRSKAREEHQREPFDLLIVDYLQLVESDGKAGNRTQDVGYISRGLKVLAKELGITIIALSQLNRAIEKRENKKPVLSDLRDGGGIEQDADIVMFIYRDEDREEITEGDDIVDILLAKHRHGETGEVQLFFRRELTQFRDLELRITQLESY